MLESLALASMTAGFSSAELRLTRRPMEEIALTGRTRRIGQPLPRRA